ncbi:carbohydrate ABC transporter permease [Limnochorda pilosa]|uniref:ABC transporter permease n=1 Tax=Limnochorda pilosa TaxID=1555112 RepID=A0A0K2SFR6_LIMPI|nr:sugar ABC transporter permease [Limnochorda pilosa]BAS25935.1 ABC transporter permease [Limnochorda pilosa]
MRLPRLAQEAAWSYLFLLPFLVTLGVFFAYAFVRTVYFSFTDYNLFAAPNWVGLKNYLDLFRERLFLTALRNSVIFAAVVTVGQTLLALALAVALNQKIRGITAFRSLYYMPSITSSVVITLIFMWLFQRTGAINYLVTLASRYGPAVLTFAGLAALLQGLQVSWERWRGLPARPLDPALLVVSLLVGGALTWALWATYLPAPAAVAERQINWLNTRGRWPAGWGAPVPLEAIMILNTWTTAPTFMLLFLAGLQDVPREFYEAAAVDGATGWTVFRRITLPHLQPVVFLVLTLGLIGTLQMFDQVAILGDQAPLEATVTLAYYVYHGVFPPGALPQVGLAAAAAVFLAVLTLVVVLVQRLVLRAE